MRKILGLLGGVALVAGCSNNPALVVQGPSSGNGPPAILLRVNNPGTSLTQVQAVVSVKSSDGSTTYGTMTGAIMTGGANDSTSLETENVLVDLPADDFYSLEVKLVVLGPNDDNRSGTWSTQSFLPRGSHNVVFSYIRFCYLEPVGCTGFLSSVSFHLR